MTERNVTVHLSIAVKVEGDAPVQDVGQMVAGNVELPPMGVIAPGGGIATITPLRIELERTHERAAG